MFEKKNKIRHIILYAAFIMQILARAIHHIIAKDLDIRPIRRLYEKWRLIYSVRFRSLHTATDYCERCDG